MSRMIPRCLALLAASVTLCLGQKDWPDERKIEFLKKASIKTTHLAPDGITGTTRATLTDGTVDHDASIQTIDVTPQAPSGASPAEPGFTDRYVYNMAAYELDRILGLHMIPATVIRNYGRDQASYTWWIDDVLMTEKQRHLKKGPPPPDEDKWNRQMLIVRVFDQLIYNMDRNLGNIVIDKDWKIWMIDHTRAFRMWKQIKDKKDLEKCDRQLLARLRQLDLQELHRRLDPHLNKAQVDALKARADLIVKFFDDAVKKRGESKVLYDYLPAS